MQEQENSGPAPVISEPLGTEENQRPFPGPFGDKCHHPTLLCTFILIFKASPLSGLLDLMLPPMFLPQFRERGPEYLAEWLAKAGATGP